MNIEKGKRGFQSYTMEFQLNSKVRKNEETGCWLWLAWIDRGGYGRLHHKGKVGLAHRMVYEHLIGQIPPGLCLDHICRVRHCVNPQHLRPVTIAENNLAPGSLCGHNSKSKTHCPAGHPYSIENTRRSKRGHRECKICRIATKRRYRERKQNE